MVALFMFTPFTCVHADRGGIVLIEGERVSETGQKAIIAWNGTHEMLMLSTDVSSSKETEVVEIMPLPSEPVISKGEKQSFLKIQELVNTYLAVINPPTRYWPSSHTLSGIIEEAPKITITFQEMIGVHNLTVVKAEETNVLIRWLEYFLEAKGYNTDLPSELEGLLPYYIQNGMNFFAIDMIEANSTVKTVDPLIYEFRSPNLYYPLRISSLFSGDTEISLFTITSNGLNDNSITKEGFVKKAQFQINQETLAEINTNMTELFSNNLYPYICYFKFSGSLDGFNGDILADFQSGLNIPSVMLATLSLGSVFVLLLLFFPVNKIGRSIRLKSVDLPTAKRLEIASFIACLIGIFLVLFSFTFPWGFVGFGEKGEVLIALNGFYETSFQITKQPYLTFS